GAQPVEAFEQPARLLLGPALEHLGHHRCRGRRDGATATVERRVLDDALVVDLEEHGQPVAAQRVVAVRLAVGILGMPEVPRPLAVVQDHLLIKLAQLVQHQPNISCTLRSASTSASTSARVLYMAKDARAVAETPKRSMSGWAQ